MHRWKKCSSSHRRLLAQQSSRWWDVTSPAERRRKPRDDNFWCGFTIIKHFTIVKYTTVSGELGKFKKALIYLAPVFIPSIYQSSPKMGAGVKEGKLQLENTVEVCRNSFVYCNELGLAMFLPHLHFLTNNFHALGFLLPIALSKTDFKLACM